MNKHGFIIFIYFSQACIQIKLYQNIQGQSRVFTPDKFSWLSSKPYRSRNHQNVFYLRDQSHSIQRLEPTIQVNSLK